MRLFNPFLAFSAIGLLAFPNPASSQTYRHEFVLDDGSAVVCTVNSTTNYSSSSKCERISREARNKGLQMMITKLSRLNSCADLAAASRDANPHIQDYSGAVLSACLGYDAYSRRRPSGAGLAYLIDCNGALTEKPIHLLLYRGRSLSDCPNLAELALSGRIPCRTDQGQ